MSSGGFSKERLDRLQNVMAGYVDRGEVPGLVLLVSRQGEVHVETIGKKEIDGDPIRRDHIFRISSMTKPIAAAAAMILVEECRLRLDEPVDRLLPELANRRVLKRLDGPVDDTEPANRPITVRDVLTFRLGHGLIFAPPGTYPIQKVIDELFGSPGPPNPPAHLAPDDWMRRFGTLPLLHQPGEQWMYHTGSEVLSVLIARAAGQPFDEFLKKRIFDPLNMNDTGFWLPPEKLGRLTPEYWTDRSTGEFGLLDSVDDTKWSRPPAFPDGGGGLVSTIDDYFAFSQMMLNGGTLGKERVLSRPSVELMTTNHLTPEQSAASEALEGQGYGFGGAVVIRRDNVFGSIGTYGWDGGLGSSWRVDPREDLQLILLTNVAWPSPRIPDHFLDFWTLVYQAIVD
jgi:CubicO group peptidase (beta-lactamase class C family)